MKPTPYRFLQQAVEINRYLQTLQAEPRLAIDLEADSLYAYPEKVCLVQISTPTANTILDPLSGGDGMEALGALLSSPSITKAFHGGDYDIRLLKKQYGFRVHNVVDTMIAAELIGRARVGLADLLAEEFGLQLNKHYQRANWSKRPLEAQMLRYAALDTAYLLPLWGHLRGELSRLGRLQWAQEEFELLEQVMPAPERPPSCFDVKGAHHLEPRERAALQALLEMREETARAWNRPPFKVLNDQVLLRWAQEPPASHQQVVQTRGANRRFLQQLAPRILEALRSVQSKPLEDCPQRNLTTRPPLSDEQRSLVRRLKAVRRAAAERLGVDAGLLVNTRTLEALARAGPQQAADMLPSALKRWQHEVLGSALRQALLG
jgi:ribonuclease D